MLRVGDIVKLVGLTGEGNKLNGELGCIVGMLPPSTMMPSKGQSEATAAAAASEAGSSSEASAEARKEKKEKEEEKNAMAMNKYTVRLFSDGSRRMAKRGHLCVGSLTREEWRECGEHRRGLWVATSLKQTELRLGQRKGGLCLGFVLYHMGLHQAVSRAQGDCDAVIDRLPVRELLLHSSIGSYDLDGATRRRAVAQLKGVRGSTDQHLELGVASYATVDWLREGLEGLVAGAACLNPV